MDSWEKPVRIGIIGASGRGLSMAELMARHAHVEIVGAADPAPAALDAARRRLGDRVLLAASDAEFYQRSDCDAVIIASGDPYHVPNALAALAHGKDVFLEKPISQQMPRLRDLVRAWERSDRVLMVGLELRQCVVFQKMRELLNLGAIGRVIMGMAFDNVSVGGRYYYHNHYRRKEYTRSLLLQKGTHTIDLLNWFIGARPTRAFCLAGMNVYGSDASARERRCRDCERADGCRHVIKRRRLTMDYGEVRELDDLCVYAAESGPSDNSMLLVDYANGSRAFYGECHFTPEYTREFTLIGDEGKMTGFYNNECEFRVVVRRADTPRETHVHEPRPVVAGGHGGSDLLTVTEFARRVRLRDRAEQEFRQIADGAAIAIAGADSEESGQPVPIPSFDAADSR